MFSDSTSGGYFTFKGGIDAPWGENSFRYGINSGIEFMYHYKTKSNWAFGVFNSVLLGNTVREDSILKSIETPGGFVLTRDGYFGDVRLYQRGIYAGLSLNKTFVTNPKYPNSGILVYGKLGYLQNKIRIQNISNDVPQVSKTYKRGYDRLRGGPALSVGLGYQSIRSAGRLNWFMGAEMSIAQTYDLRSVHFDQSIQNPTQIDGFVGIRAGVILPFFKNKAERYYY
jgi:hypothetical protein